MSSTFDNKVYELISDGSSITFDEIYPVGSIVRRSPKIPPNQGTWKLCGIYGTHEYTDTSNDTSTNSECTIHHHLVFQGTSVIDYIKIDPCTDTWVQFTYTSLFGQNYKFYAPASLTRNTNGATSWYGEVINSTDESVGVSFVDGQTHLRIDKSEGTAGVSAVILIQLTDDLDNYSFGTVLMNYEYKRTN